MGREYSAYHAAACLSCLPPGSALLTAMEPSLSWSNTDYLIHAVLCALAGKEIEYPWEKKKTSGIDGIETESLPLDQFIDWYENSTFEEVKEWREIQ